MSGDFGQPAGTQSRVGPGSRIAGYVIEEQVGAGGMAVVFRARDEALGRLAAVKVLAPALAADQDFRARFERERRLLASVDEPHILPVYAAGEADGVLYIATRFVSGGDLARELQNSGGLLQPGRVATLIGQVAAALDAAHAVGLVHRDVKPGNVLIENVPGRPEHAYLSDFGISKATNSATQLTATGTLMATPDFCPPELLSSQYPVSARSDQYSLGCVAFNMLTGTVPYQRQEAVAAFFAHVNDPVPFLTSRRPQLPAAADAVVARAMAKNPAERYQSCSEFAAALAAALTQPHTSPAGPAGAFAAAVPPLGGYPAASPAAGYPATPSWAGGHPTAASAAGYPATPSWAGGHPTAASWAGGYPTAASQPGGYPATGPSPWGAVSPAPGKKHTGLLAGAGIVAAVIVVVVALVLATTSHGGSGSTATGKKPVHKSLLAEVTTVPASTLNTVGAGTVADTGDGGIKATFIGSPLRSGGKPEVFYESAEYCPYCAPESWGLIVALSRFGTFSGLKTISSAANDTPASVPGWTFYGSTYTSAYITLSTVETETNIPNGSGGYQKLQTPTHAQQALINQYNFSDAIPFADFGNRYTQIGDLDGLEPNNLSGSWANIAGSLDNVPSANAQAVDGGANWFTAAICKLTSNQPASACTPAVKSLGQRL